jgi:hypothetical protein
MKYAVESFKCHDTHTKFHKDLFRHLKVNKWGFKDTQTAW